MPKRKIKVPDGATNNAPQSEPAITCEEYQRRYKLPAYRIQPAWFSYLLLFGKSLTFVAGLIFTAFSLFFKAIAWSFYNIDRLMMAAFSAWIITLLYITGHIILKSQGYLP